VEPARDAEDFLARPAGRYLAGARWISFCASEQLSGFVLWGQPDARDVRSLIEVSPFESSLLASPMARWIDVRRVESPHPEGFSVLATHFAAHANRLEKLVTRAAVLHSGGLVAAVVAGFDGIVPTPYPISAFTEPKDALVWLGFAGDARFVGELDEIQASSLGTTPLLRDLRGWLSRRLQDASLPEAAAALGTSPRSLQRRLHQHGTSFQNQLIALRVEVAQRLLLETDAQVTEIAYEVGCASVHHLGVIFRKATGITPTRWRSERRAASPSRDSGDAC
jgi:AraC-like DNA-binding protein